MKHLSRIAALVSFGAALALPAAAASQHDHGEHAPAAGAHVPAEGHAEGHGEAHAEGHGDHAPTFDDINWGYGFLGEKEGVEPGLLWRPKGMPVPFGALLLNAGILYWLIFKFGRKPIADALKARQVGIMKGMEDAAKMKAEAEASLAKYQKQLDEIDEEVARIKREAKEQSEAEGARIVSEAKERRTRLERDARTLIEQELKAAREELLRETVRAAVRSAEVSIAAKIGESDQVRLGDEYLASIKASGAALRGRL
ncbi:MAG: synthase subunit [Polyangiaceae bacterium]|jgi:F-type H+-transporting ATPase subunit b|nr:synthase subunit [Polyangiaceae bacterium]